MADDKAVFVVDDVKIGKVWDKKMGKPAADAFKAGVEKGIGKVVRSVGKDEKGFMITLTLESMEFDEKKNVLTQVVKGVIVALPEDKYVAGVSHTAKMADANPKKLEGDVKFMCEDSGGKLAAKIRKEVG